MNAASEFTIAPSRLKTIAHCAAKQIGNGCDGSADRHAPEPGVEGANALYVRARKARAKGLRKRRKSTSLVIPSHQGVSLSSSLAPRLPPARAGRQARGIGRGQERAPEHSVPAHPCARKCLVRHINSDGCAPCRCPARYRFRLPAWLTRPCLCGALLFGALGLRAEPSTGDGWTVARAAPTSTLCCNGPTRHAAGASALCTQAVPAAPSVPRSDWPGARGYHSRDRVGWHRPCH